MTGRRLRRAGGVVAFVVAGLLAGCSTTSPSNDGVTTPATPRPSRSPGVESTSGNSGPPTATVSITTARTDYRVGDVVHVTIRNDGPEDVVAASGQAYCTVVAVERSTGDAWRPAATCQQGAPPGLIPIAAGTNLSLDLPPDRASDRLPAGTYRLRCVFSVGSSDGPSGEARSNVFVIRS